MDNQKPNKFISVLQYIFITLILIISSPIFIPFFILKWAIVEHGYITLALAGWSLIIFVGYGIAAIGGLK